jgi:hypothetical protein
MSLISDALRPKRTAHCEEVYDLVGMRPEQMRAENALAPFFDQHLKTSMVCAYAPLIVPSRGASALHVEFQPLLSRRFFAETD